MSEPLSPSLLDDLERRAREATPGPEASRACSCGRCMECNWAASHEGEDPAFRGPVDLEVPPEVVLSLVEEVRRLRAQVAALACSSCVDCKHDPCCCMGCPLCNRADGGCWSEHPRRA